MKYFRFPKRFKNLDNYAVSKCGFIGIDQPDTYDDIYVYMKISHDKHQGSFYGETNFCVYSKQDYYDLVDMIDHIL